MSKPELSRIMRLDRIGPNETPHEVVASAAECASLARRFGIPGIVSLTCRFVLRRLPGSVVSAEGLLEARVTRICVATLEAFDAPVRESFRFRFVPEDMLSDSIDPDADDEIPYQHDTIDLGEAAAQQLALALDPYPRKPGARMADVAADPAERRLGNVVNFRRQ